MNPRYPIYIVSRSRWDTRMTSKALEMMGVPYRIVVEQQQYKQYTDVISKKKVLVLDPRYQDEYDTCDDLGDSKSKGPGAARNFAWDHSISIGAKSHWVMDDNIRRFYRFNRGLRIPVDTGSMFRACEDFVDRYENVAISGPQYYMFISNFHALPAFTLNTRIYSCNLIRNDIPFRWRGRYNEDTDLSLQALKSNVPGKDYKWCTVQFNVLLQCKMPTQTVKGGCDEVFYSQEGTMPKSVILTEMHPDVARLTWKFHRWHHEVNYRRFRYNRLVLKSGVVPQSGVNDYGMMLRDV